MPQFFSSLRFGTELIYTFLVLILCLVIYYKTKESYQLTKHSGIKYFREAFLFLGLSYLLRLLFSILILSDIAFDVFIPRKLFLPILIIPLGYLSTMAIFYLMLSPLRKRLNSKNAILFFHCVAVLLSIISFITGSIFSLLYLQIFLLLIAVIMVFMMRKKNNKNYTSKILYPLLVLFWLINLWILRPGPFVPFILKIFFQILSLIVLFTIYHKVSKWLR